MAQSDVTRAAVIGPLMISCDTKSGRSQEFVTCSVVLLRLHWRRDRYFYVVIRAK